MNRLQKFVEESSNGQKSGRIAYVFGPDKLPDPTAGFAWQPVPFHAGDELIKNADLKKVFQTALDSGCATARIGC